MGAEAHSAREVASSCHPWSSGVNAAMAKTMSAVAGGGRAGTTTFTATQLHCDESSEEYRRKSVNYLRLTATAILA